jgi:hypothetical protein
VSPRRWAALATGLLALAPAGCASNDGGKGSSLVDPAKRPPINSLDIDPDSGALLLTTNRGFFRIANGRAARVRGVVRTADGPSPVGTFLAVKALGSGRYLGSGHPDRKGKVEDFLGVLRSENAGRSWRVVGRYGLSDLHVLRLLHDRIYAYDAVLPGLLISEDDGKKWSEKATPRGLVLDAVVDPEDRDYVLASNENEIFRSEDAGNTWRSITQAPSARLDWPTPDRLYRADKDGAVYRSDDGGEEWDTAGRIDGEPWKLKAAGPEELYAALSDATIVHSKDGGRTWKERFKP